MSDRDDPLTDDEIRRILQGVPAARREMRRIQLNAQRGTHVLPSVERHLSSYVGHTVEVRTGDGRAMEGTLNSILHDVDNNPEALYLVQLFRNPTETAIVWLGSISAVIRTVDTPKGNTP